MSFWRKLLALKLVVVLAGCSLIPDLKMPTVQVAPEYKETAPWIKAEPSDQIPRGSWWTYYKDDELNKLQELLLKRNSNLAAAYATYQRAQAYVDQAGASRYPGLSLNGSPSRNRASENRPLVPSTFNLPPTYSLYSVGLQAGYEVDLWGRVSSSVKASEAGAAAVTADLESVKLSLQTKLVDQFIVLRGIDQQLHLLQETVDANAKALKLIQIRYDNGIAPGLDVSRAEAQLESAKSQLEQAKAQRAISEHAIAVLTGQSPSSFSLVSRDDIIDLPKIPISVPSELLQRRPDIAAAQRRVEAANASIGVAKAALYPSVNLSATYGYQSISAGNWLTAPSNFWSIGPGMLLQLFDGGLRKAKVAEAEAILNENGARYRVVVLEAFQQVEDNLAKLNYYHTAAQSEKASAEAAKKSLSFAMNRYQQGAANYLEVTSAQTASLNSQRALLILNTEQLRASVDLIRALGGGWSKNVQEAG
ncbi:efflux transporter outer membrane subunit [Methylophilus sp. 13]|uniref:efflux transporter outer membrane subunit n=1 Tax=Methylophilus sp. 13 TaxID=2781018 RepID=UPI00188FDD8B|nr:efflux transporter outer membrane subunit [Methylophilus sp. 13]MBF5037926.1 efflux transporter outer membrane subunit [Methylophilus sp. 13]